MNHLETVHAIYAAFGRGDVQDILSRLADDVEWDYDVSRNDIPWLQPRRGPHEVLGFFQTLEALEFERFEPHTLLANDDVVVALIRVGLRVKATGRRITEEDETHVWRFDAEGRVGAFTHKIDTLAHWRALHGEHAGPAEAMA